MTITKIKNKSLVTNDDLEHNIRMGLPIEIYCPMEQCTVAFGRIESYNSSLVYVNGNRFCRKKNFLFGFPAQ